MPLEKLLAAISSLEPTSSPDLPAGGTIVGGIAYDTRRLAPGDLFVCATGRQHDAHAFAPEAWTRGAVAVIGERAELLSRGPYVRVSDSRRALALLSARLHDHVSRRLALVGITGTNGKTSVSWMLASIWDEAGIPAAVIGTLGSGHPPELVPSPHTTPEAPELQGELARLYELGTRAVALEVSSHGLALERTYGTRFRVGVFTNLTKDHLDFHGTMEAYAAAKNRFFRSEERGPEEGPMVAVVNGDDPWLPSILAGTRDQVWRYGRDAAHDVALESSELSPSGIALVVRHPGGRTRLVSRLLGEFQVDNLLAAFTAALALGIAPEIAARGLARMASIPGRMERVEADAPFSTVVDYAHTPDALGRALHSLRPFTPGRLVLLFGCGGDRDHSKRGEMGRVAAKLADLVILTDDNPRTEDPEAIRREVRAGLEGGATPWMEIGDRATAIASALREARAGDTVLLAGKGHERVQITGTEVRPFDDRAVARVHLETRPRWTLGEIARAAGGTLSSPSDAKLVIEGPDLCSDSRKLEAGSFFVALRGERFDGHDFLAEAVARGARGALVESRRAVAGLPCVEVEETLAALQRWAGDHRRRWRGGSDVTSRLVAVTGSSGKTTTKDLLSGLLAGVGPTLATAGNLNNQIGVPWTLLRLAPAHERAVVELGMNHAGEIAELSRLARPDLAVLTDVGTAHVGHLGSREAILAAKLEILEGLDAHAPWVVPDDPWILERLPRRNGRRVTFGLSGEADWRPLPGSIVATLDGTRFSTAGTGEVTLGLVGPGALRCALAALAASDALGLDVRALAPRLESAERRPMRMEPRREHGVIWLLDCYNASPESTRLALEFTRTVPHDGRRVLVLGELGELGAKSEEIHRELGNRAARPEPEQARFARAFFIGSGARVAAEAFGAGAEWFATTAEAGPAVRAAVSPGDLVLLKGSRRTALEQILDGAQSASVGRS